MPWSDRYKKASFRGVKFNVQSASTELGRRTIFYDLPMDESGGSAARDMGMHARRYSITAVLCGVNYDADRDDLIDALEKPGAGDLVHPYLGKVKVYIDGPVSIVESTEEGGLCRIQFTFRKYRDQGTPSLGVDTISLLSQAADTALGAINTDFANTFSVDAIQEFVREANLDVLSDLTDELRAINRDIDSILAIPGNIASQIDAFSAELADLLNTPQELANAVQAFIASIVGSLNRVLGSDSRDTDAIGSLLSISRKTAALGSTIADVPMTFPTPARKKQRANQTALIRLFRGSAIASVASVASGLDYDSSQQAINVQTTLVDQVNAFLESSVLDDDAVYEDSADAANLVAGDGPQIDLIHESMRAMAAALTKHLRQVAGELPALTTFAPAETLPAVVLAYLLYEDAEQNLDIVARNISIDHPNFVMGGRALEAISNG